MKAFGKAFSGHRTSFPDWTEHNPLTAQATRIGAAELEKGGVQCKKSTALVWRYSPDPATASARFSNGAGCAKQPGCAGKANGV